MPKTMKPRFDHLIKRPGGRTYDMSGKTDLARTFKRLRDQAREDKAEREEKVAPLVRKRA